MLHNILPVFGSLHAIHALDLLCCRLHHVRLAYGHLIGIRQRILLTKRIQEIFLIAEAFREALLRLCTIDVFDGFNPLKCTDFFAKRLLLCLLEIILDINADLYLRLQKGSGTVHIQCKNEKHPENKEGYRDSADCRECHPIVPAQGAKDLLHKVFTRSNLHSHIPRAPRRAQYARPQWQSRVVSSYRRYSCHGSP